MPASVISALTWRDCRKLGGTSADAQQMKEPDIATRVHQERCKCNTLAYQESSDRFLSRLIYIALR